MKNLPPLQQQRDRNGHASTSGKLGAAIPGTAMLIAMLTLAPGCGKKEDPSTAPPVQDVTSQPATPAPVQRQQYAPTPPPVSPTPIRQTNAAYPAGVPTTRPAGSTRPVPVVP